LRNQRHVILTFHRILPVGAAPERFDTCPAIPTDYFAGVLRAVKKKFSLVTLGELIANRQSRAPLASVTFDDGWRDNHDNGLPILKDLGVPATIFISTAKIGSPQPFWQQELGQIFAVASRRPDSNRDQSLRHRLRIPSDAPLDPACYRAAVGRWKRKTRAQIETDLRGLTQLMPDRNQQERLFLSREEIVQMRAAGVAIGSHTANHAILTAEDDSTVDRELRQSKAELEEILTATVDAFSYPNGSFSSETARKVGQCGYTTACTTVDRPVRQGDDRLLLPRIDVGRERLCDRTGAFNPDFFLSMI
jgi:peptidoglycan/xylan/chitin deacetylase (PgdA/CDA1 family)